MKRHTKNSGKIFSGYRKRLIKLCALLPVLICGFFFFLPIGILASGSIADAQEWGERLRPLLTDGEGFLTWKWIPDYPTGEHFKRLLFYSPAFLKLFWNSVATVGAVLLGQLLIGVPAAWAFAVYRFRGRKILFRIYMILMLLPFQVVMLSRYLVLKRLQLLDTGAAVILPAVFSTFPVFLLYRSFTQIPGEILEAARIDGAGEGRIFWQIGLPLTKGGVLACLVLGFLESWNMMEEPLAFLKDKALWLLPLYLPKIGIEQAGFASAASMLTLTISLFVFGMFHDSLEQGIAANVDDGRKR